MMRTMHDDISMQKYLTKRRIAETFLGIGASFRKWGMKAILRYHNECVDSPCASKLICNDRLFTIPLAALLFGAAGFLYGGHWDRERLKGPGDASTRSRARESIDAGVSSRGQ